MESKKSMTIGLYNTFFNETPWNDSLSTWFGASVSAIQLRSTKKLYELQSIRKHSDVARLIEEHDPDVLVLHELLPQCVQEINTLLDEKYKFVDISDPSCNSVFPHTLLAISNRHEVDLDSFRPGRGVGDIAYGYIPDEKIAIIGCNPSAMSSRKRAAQLQNVADMAKLEQERGNSVLVIGDLNAERAEVDPFFESFSLQCIDKVPYPHEELYNQMQEFPWQWLKHLMGLQNGQRYIDHIWMPDDWKIENIAQFKGLSDHYGVIVQATVLRE